MPAPRPSKRQTAVATLTTPPTFTDLLRAVRAELFTGRVKIEHAWLMMFHNIGRLIQEHVLLFRDRADYAARTFNKLSAGTGVSKRVLHEWAQFYRYFPIVRQSAQLTRTRFRRQCQVGDEKPRDVLNTSFLFASAISATKLGISALR